MSINRFEGRESGNAKRRKRAKTKAFSPLSLGQHYPRHYPPQPGPFLGRPGPFQTPSGQLHVELGPGKLGPPLSLKQVAGLIGCSPWTVRQTLIPRGLPHLRFTANGRLTFFTKQVISWIENQQQGG